jgi:hypothetical protein
MSAVSGWRINDQDGYARLSKRAGEALDAV